MSIRFARAWSVAVATTALPLAAVAHGGHGDPRQHESALHFLLEPVHLPLTLAAVAALVFAAAFAYRKARRTGSDARRIR